MSKRRIKMSLSESSINDAIRRIQDYKNSLVNEKIETFVRMVAELGRAMIVQVVGQISSEENEDPNWTIDYDYKDHSATLYAKNKKILFIEFSAGITYGMSNFQSLPNGTPYGTGYGMGTFNPQSDKWKDPDGWWYQGEDGEFHHTYGNAAYTPMYTADVEMHNNLVRIAKHVFGG